jgi:hypothetical protein
MIRLNDDGVVCFYGLNVTRWKKVPGFFKFIGPIFEIYATNFSAQKLAHEKQARPALVYNRFMENSRPIRPPSRLAAVIVILGALFGLVFSIAGLVLLWTTRDTVSAQASDYVGLAGRTIGAAQQTTGVFDRTLSQAGRDLEMINTLINNLGITLDNSGELIDSTAELVGTDMLEFVDNTQTSLRSVEISAGLIDDFLSVISSVPFIGGRYRPEVPLRESVQRVSQSMDPLPEAFTQIQRDLRVASSNASTLRGQVQGMARQVQAIQTSMEDARRIVLEYEDIFTELSDRQERFAARLDERMELLYWVITAFLGWIALSQLGALLSGISMLRQ